MACSEEDLDAFCGVCCCCGCCGTWWLAKFMWRWNQRRGLSNEDIEFLKMELRSILAALRLVEMVPPEMLPRFLNNWAARSREASYDIQDILDTFLVRVEEVCPDTSDGQLVWKKAPSSLGHSNWCKFAHAIIDVKKLVHKIAKDRARYTDDGFLAADAIRVQEIAERLYRYRADTNPGGTSVDPRLLELIKDGRRRPALPDGAMEDVIGSLSMDSDDTSNHQLKTVCIVGVGGLGRTSLARAVYQKLQPQFDCSAFVSLSQNPDVSNVLRTILQQLDNGEQVTERWDVPRLVDQLRQLLQNKRYMIAVDDILDSKSWEEIRSAMVDNNLGSRIITTTGMSEVAEQVGGAYELRPLSNDDSVSILWKILLESYCQLPSHLRPCFLYISMFPEGYLFRRDRLVWRWIAEGFIEGKEGCSLFQIGQKYFNELLNRSLITEIDIEDSDGMANKYFRVHYMVLDLACSLARDENFVTKLVDQPNGSFISLGDKVHRLSLQNSQLWRAHTLVVKRHLRSVGAFGTIITLTGHSSFNILRVLDLEGSRLITGSYYNQAPLGKLLHLRYLGLRGTNVSQLPEDIGNLRFLQILDVKGNGIRELPSTVALLHRLLCLYAEPETRVPKGMGNLRSLEELTKVSISESPSLMVELSSLVELRVLGIVLKQGMSESLEKDFVKSLCNLHKLQSLGIYGNSKLDFLTKEGWAPPPGLRRFVSVDGWFPELPTWISNAESLLELQIGLTELWQEGLQSLGRLPELRFLNLTVERMGERLAVHADAFPKLTLLRISSKTCLVFRPGAMPKVEALEFVLDVHKADGDFSWGLSNLHSLEKVTAKLHTGNSASANKEAEAAVRHAVDSHPNNRRIKLEILTVTSPNKQMESLDDRAAGNVASSSEIQEERYAL